MKKFFRCVLDGILATVAVVLFTVIMWAFLTLAAGIIVGFSPVWAVLLVRAKQKVDSFKEEADKALDNLENMLNSFQGGKDATK